MSQYASVNDVLNRVAVEVGFDSSNDPLADTNKIFNQLRFLMNSAAEELIQMHPWTEMQKEHSFTTSTGTASYSMPTDFAYMIDQTGWDRTKDMPLGGPLSPQEWQYLKGRDLTNQTIYASFRIKQREVYIYPDNPVPNALSIAFEYMSDKWLQDASSASTFYNEIDAGDDIILFPKIVAIKILKCKWLEARGFDSSKAREDFAVMMFSTLGHDGSASILNIGGSRGFPYMNAIRNTPDTNFGT